MKKVILIAAVALMGLTACSTLTGTTTGSTTPTTTSTTATGTTNDGQTAGAALRALYTQYKADGKYDYTNLNNAINAIQLVQACQNLKSNVKDGDYWKNFASGLILPLPVRFQLFSQPARQLPLSAISCPSSSKSPS